MSVVLGLMHHTHDAAACLLGPDRFLAAVEEERVSRAKHTSAFPAGAIEASLRAARLPYSAVTRVAYPWRPDRRALYGLGFLLRRLPGSLRVLRARGDGDVLALLGLPGRLAALAREHGWAGLRPPRFHYVDHHLAHAAYAWFTSPFDRGLVVTHDFCGEYHSVFAGLGEGDRVTPLFRLAYPDSLGFVYSAVTEWLGFLRNSDEGKVMGLAPYGDERFVSDFRAMVDLMPDGRFRLDESWFDIFYYDARGGESAHVSERFRRRFGPPRAAGEPLDDRHRAVARALQALVESTTLHLVGTLARLHRVDAVCLSGGVALNACANGRLLDESVVRRLHAPPAAGDAGAACGAALFVRKAILREPGRVAADPYLGTAHPDAAVERAFRRAGLDFSRVADPAEAAAELLAAGGVVGWFQGRMEFGPRALGNRSILADARDPRMRDRLNAEVKHREMFRPYAPAVTLEAFPRFFAASEPSPFMLKVHRVRPECRPLVPSIVHVDGTARVQTVSPADNPLFHRLLEAFGRRTGVPLLLNTSFNDRGEPIVESPDDAAAFFLKSPLDALVAGPFVARRRPA